jgi:AcrR family transcriptional regulator
MNKKETIFNVALQLFSNQGFDNTSTSLIAKKAEVSEGLIFRHFTNKEGLLNEILIEGFTKIKPYLDLIISEEDPKNVILLTLELPYKIISQHREFWKLQNNLRLQNDKYRQDFDQNAFFEPLDTKVRNAFELLKHENPRVETDTFFTFLNGLALFILENDNTENPVELIKNIELKFIR